MLDAVRAMAQHDIGSLVVMDHGRMTGLVTFAEVLQALAAGGGALDDLRSVPLPWPIRSARRPASTSWNCGA